ncbi:hypothetical protein [Pseudalkalibacillus hwajinpoensis]|uniref:Uncharacterized protein n=1 Tax=Guptibacillus hwajinpoensis TaxID=208199 RepID=A0A4U1MGP8_9BACL|nr:hypothetical protein [Pseudalkalibacillus hwajinpoensis]TKD69881.1 hypothetical protein FBF83_11450 [Pseudalkalibacillus hwajinpoensis]
MMIRLFRLVGVFCFLYLAESNLNLNSMTFTDVMLNSARYGLGAICFLVGFLFVARIIRDHVEGFISFSLQNSDYLRTFIIEVSILTGVYWILFQDNKWISLSSLVMALMYGGLSANVSAAKAIKRFRRSNEA